MNNRLKFITIGNEKDNKKLQMVRRKFEKVVGIRSESLKEKEILSKVIFSCYFIDKKYHLE